MKLVAIANGVAGGIGAVIGDLVLDLTAAWPVVSGERAAGAPRAMVELLGAPGRLQAVRDHARGPLPQDLRPYAKPLAATALGAPIPRPGKLLCVASNYAAHIEESGRTAPTDRETITPWLFLKPPTCVRGPGEPILIPAQGQAVDWEVELAVVIGRPGRHIP